jgi:hypothetical protein
MRPLVAHCLLGLGQCAAMTGKRLSAEEHLIAASTLFVELNMSRWRERVEMELKSFRAPLGSKKGAQEGESCQETSRST